MNVFAASAAVAAVALISLVAAFAWLAARGDFKRRAMSAEEAARHAARGGQLTPNVGALLAFPFWPFFLLQVSGVPAPLAGLVAVAFAVIAFRTLRGFAPRG